MWPNPQKTEELLNGNLHFLCSAPDTNTSAPWTQEVNWTYTRRSESDQNVFWTFYVRSIYVLRLRSGKPDGDEFDLLKYSRSLVLLTLLKRHFKSVFTQVKNGFFIKHLCWLLLYICNVSHRLDKFKNGPSKTCGRKQCDILK